MKLLRNLIIGTVALFLSALLTVCVGAQIIVEVPRSRDQFARGVGRVLGKPDSARGQYRHGGQERATQSWSHHISPRGQRGPTDSYDANGAQEDVKRL